MGRKTRFGSRIRIRDEHPGSYFRELRKIFVVKILKLVDAVPEIFLTLDPECKIRIRDKHLGFATLVTGVYFVKMQ
jgi:hypothetical protein